jgi:hypothetical protein
MTSITNTTLPGSTVEQEKVLFTTEALVDELFICLAGVQEIITIKENSKQVLVRKYYRQARDLFRWIPIAGADCPFIINLSDLTPRIKSEFDDLEITTVCYILKEAAGRLFENLDFNYYHLSIVRNLKVKLQK